MIIVDNYKAKVFNYKIAMSLANKLFHEGTISKSEYARIDTIMTKKYGLSSCSIFRENKPYLLDNTTL